MSSPTLYPPCVPEWDVGEDNYANWLKYDVAMKQYIYMKAMIDQKKRNDSEFKLSEDCEVTMFEFGINEAVIVLRNHEDENRKDTYMVFDVNIPGYRFLSPTNANDLSQITTIRKELELWSF